jgi:hypothetical protein
MVKNTAAAGGFFSDAWDDECPTVVEHWRRLPGKQLAPTARDIYAGLTDTGIRAAFRNDTGATYQDLTAVSS